MQFLFLWGAYVYNTTTVTEDITSIVDGATTTGATNATTKTKSSDYENCAPEMFVTSGILDSIIGWFS